MARDDPAGGDRCNGAAPAWATPARRREALLLAVCEVGLALNRLSALHRATPAAHYGERVLTDRDLARALPLDLAEARALHLGALLALGHELARLGEPRERLHAVRGR